jgi:DNA/RNA endonuclease G (NUC1)
MKSPRVFAAILFSVISAVGLHATIGVALQMQLGNPSTATSNPSNQTHFLIQRDQYAMDYNNTTREPNWVSWDLTTTDVGSSGRSDFIVDTTLPAGFYQVQTTDYSGSGFDRGHMCPSADRTVTVADNQIVFYMSNMIPQAPDNNQGVWASFETYCRTLAAAGNEVLITSGPSGFAGSTIASGVAIPGYTWKIAVVVPLGGGTALSRITSSTRVIAIKIPNIAGVRNNPWQQYITSAAQIEADTGYTFFTALPPSTAAALRLVVDGQVATGSPSIVTQPVAQTAPLGGNATFTVAATGDATLTYQWLKDDVEIPGATSPTLNLLNVQLTDVASYDVIVTNGVGSVTSNGAALIISGLPPVVTTPPASKTVAAGSNVTFSVTAGGSPPFTYLWRKGGVGLANGGNVSGVTGATLSLTNVQAADIASYDVVVTNSVTSVISSPASLNVTPAAPTITTAPVPQTISVGGTATFSVVATGTTPLSYQWRKGGVGLSDGGIIAGTHTATLTLTGVAAGDAGSYDVVVSNGLIPDATSTPVVLTISVAPAGTQTNYPGGSYTQTFDTLPATGTFVIGGVGSVIVPLSTAPIGAGGMDGWTFSKYAGSGTTTAPLFTVNNGASNSGSVFSYGATSTTDRALGSLASGTTVSRFGVSFVNTTGQTITQFTLSYTGEQWRRGSGAANTLTFGYSVGGTDINTGTFTTVAALNFTAPNTTGTNLALDGNSSSPANRTALSSTVSGLSWAPGQVLVLRWSDVDDSANDDGLGIDDLTFTTPVGAAPVTPAVVSTSPANAAVNVPGNAPISVTFNQAVTVSGSWFSINSAANGAVAATVTGGPTTFTLTPPVSFADNDVVTVTLVAAQVTEQATGTLHLASNYTFAFNTAAPVAPGITVQPLPQTALAGGTASFTVGAGGTPPFSYQWRKGGVAISGNASATSATLVLTNVQAADAVSYDVIVSNGVSPAATSSGALLTVTPAAPTITLQPVPQTVAAGGAATFTVAASGTAPFSYQWRKGGVNLTNGLVVSGATSATLVLTGVTTGDTGSYDVVVSNGVSPAATSTAVSFVVTGGAGSPLNYAGGTYAQNFDSLLSTGTVTLTGAGPLALDAAPPNGVNASGLAGWSLSKYAGTGANALFKFDNGGSNAGSALSYGATGASDRALGSLASAAIISRFGVTLVNTTGQSLTQFTLSYVGEQWRHGGALIANKLAFSYLVGATNINTGTFTAATALDFVAPIITATTSALDGNAAANRLAISSTITGLTWNPGQTLVLRWTDVDDAGADDGLAIDDLTFSAPVPAATQTYVAWAAAKGLAPGQDGPAQDPEADGIVNLLEYFLGLQPTVSDSAGLPTGGIEAGEFIFRFTRNKLVTGATYEVLTSTDLVTWNSAPAAVRESETTDLETFVVSLPMTSPRLFAKLEVTFGATTIATVPVGYMNVAIAGGTPGAPVITPVGLPLDKTSAPPAGIRAGLIESFTANTLTQSGGGWTANLGGPVSPWLAKITSGSSAGRTLDVVSNTATTLTLSGADLTTLGLVAGADTFELVRMETLFSLFGSAALQGGTSASAADNVQVRSGTTWLAYYFDTTLGYWRRTIGPATNSNNVLVRPQSGVQIVRRAPALTLTFTGRAPATPFRAPVNNASSTVIHAGFPTDTTLGALALQTKLPAWTGGDLVGLYNGTAWVTYLFNGSFWQTASGPAVVSDNVAIPAGALITIQRAGTTPGVSEFVRALPYSL